MRIVFLLLAVVMAAACSSSEESAPESTTAVTGDVADPAETVGRWLRAVDAGDAAAAADLVEERTLALLVAAENPMTAEQLAVAVDSGLSEGIHRSYWESFRNDFAAFAGDEVGAVVVAGYEEFVAGGRAFAGVEVSDPDGAVASEVVTVMGGDGRWRVDLMATLGPSFVRPLRIMLVGLPAGPAGDAVRAAFGDAALPALRAALARDPGERLPEAFRIELEALVGFLESAG